jgi:hypothetical protein
VWRKRIKEIPSQGSARPRENVSRPEQTLPSFGGKHALNRYPPPNQGIFF